MTATVITVAEARAATEARWKINLTWVWIGVFVGLLGANFVFPFVPFYIKELGVTDKGEIATWTSLSGSATGVSLFLTAPLWGSMADRFGRKPMFLRALLGAGLLILVMGLAQNVWQFIGLRFAMGAFAGTMGAAAALVAATTPREKTGQALGLLQTAQFSSNMLGPLIGGPVAQFFGLRESFYFCAALYLVACAGCYIFVKEPRASRVAQPIAVGRPAASGGLVANLKSVLAERQIVVMLGVLFALWLSTTFVRPLLPLSIDDFSTPDGGTHVDWHLGFTTLSLGEKIASSYVFAGIGLTSTIAALSLGPISKRFGYKRCVATAAAGTGIFFIPVALANNYTSFLLFFAMTGVFQGAMVPGMNALIAAATPDGKQGSAFGLAASMQSLALTVGPIAGGLVVRYLGLRWDYAIIGIILMMTSVLAFIFVKDPPKPPARAREPATGGSA